MLYHILSSIIGAREHCFVWELEGKKGGQKWWPSISHAVTRTSEHNEATDTKQGLSVEYSGLGQVCETSGTPFAAVCCYFQLRSLRRSRLAARPAESILLHNGVCQAEKDSGLHLRANHKRVLKPAEHVCPLLQPRSDQEQTAAKLSMPFRDSWRTPVPGLVGATSLSVITPMSLWVPRD